MGIQLSLTILAPKSSSPWHTLLVMAQPTLASVVVRSVPPHWLLHHCHVRLPLLVFLLHLLLEDGSLSHLSAPGALPPATGGTGWPGLLDFFK